MTSSVVPNHAKRDRYAKAHERLNLALEHEFYIEAAMICESIIADRLHSHLHWRIVTAQVTTLQDLNRRLARKDKRFRGKKALRKLEYHSNLMALIAAVKLDFDDFQKDHYVKLPDRLDQWRKDRNDITHNVVYTVPTLKTYQDEFADFVRSAQKCAQQGQELASLISNWDRMARRKSVKQEEKVTESK